ncbi:unnamed protein product [Trifolium pratense]|uniref:Uncharacterized protein n=1 Tax=Trifolium pratense TaxID=57577 RepID=A0ACB0JUP1_TRIPR|nr:unnamed protein product [Trifolium pratense]
MRSSACSSAKKLAALGLPTYNIFTIEEIEDATNNFERSKVQCLHSKLTLLGQTSENSQPYPLKQAKLLTDLLRGRSDEQQLPDPDEVTDGSSRQEIYHTYYHFL